MGRHGPVYDRVIIGDETFDFPKGEDQLKAALIGRFPDEAVAIERYFELVHRVLACLPRYFTEKALPPFLSMFLGPFLRRAFLRYSDKTLAQVLEELTQNQRLRAVLSAQCGDYGLPPSEASFAIHAMVASHYFEGGYYPIGGAERIAETIVPVIEAAAGKVLSRAEVAEIVVENGRAVGVWMEADGRILRAPVVISDAGVANTFGRLLSPSVAQKYGLARRLNTARPSGAHLCLYIGLAATAAELDLPKHNIWIYPDDEIDRCYAEGLKDPEAACLSAYLSFPSAKDPDFTNRCPGRATIDVITFVSYEAFSRWEESHWKKRPAEYEQLKERLDDDHAGDVVSARAASSRQSRRVRTLDSADDAALCQPAARRNLRHRSHAEPLPPEMVATADADPRPVSHRAGHRHLRRGGALFGGVLAASAVLRRNLLSTIAQSAEAREKLPEADQSPVHEPSPTSTSA